MSGRSVLDGLLTGTLLAACTASSEPATDAGSSTAFDVSVRVTTSPTTTRGAAPTTDRTTTTLAPAALVWQPGTVTCADLEGNVPVGVDDFGYTHPGLLEFRWGDGLAETIQFADDATCTEESDAWRFLIRPILPGFFDGADPSHCELFLSLRTTDEPPANLAAVLAVADELCR